MFKKILLASDGSKHALRATDKAIDLAKLVDDATIEIIYVVDFEVSKSDVLHAADLKSIQHARKQRLQSTEQKIKEAGVNFATTILHGEPGPTIVSYANKNSFDIVVVGSRGLNTLQEMVLGSVSHKVAKRVECPVLIVK